MFQSVNIIRTFRLAVLAQKWWITDYAIECPLHFYGEPGGMLKVVVDEFLEDTETLVDFE